MDRIGRIGRQAVLPLSRRLLSFSTYFSLSLEQTTEYLQSFMTDGAHH